MLPPLDAPAKLPPLPAAASEAADGDGSSAVLGLSASQLRQLAADAYLGTLPPQLLPAATAALGLDGAASASSLASFSEEEGGRASALINRLPDGAGAAASAPGGSDTSSSSGGRAWEAELAAEIAAGEGPVLAALGGYLSHLETAAEGGGSADGDGELAAAIAAFDAPATPEGCFPALFGR